MGVMGDLTSSPTSNCCHPWKHPLISMVPLPHLWILSPLNNCCSPLEVFHQGKLSFGSSSKCSQVLDAPDPWCLWYFKYVFRVSCTLYPLKFRTSWVINPTFWFVSRECTSPHPTNLFLSASSSFCPIILGIVESPTATSTCFPHLAKLLDSRQGPTPYPSLASPLHNLYIISQLPFLSFSMTHSLGITIRVSFYWQHISVFFF